jgi:hypothetical protein
MKHVTILCTLLISVLFPFMSSAQFNVLFVDDNDYLSFNTDTFRSSLTASGYIYTEWNAQLNGIPDINTVSGFDLVIWYTSTDGVGLQLWSANDTDNLVIQSYLDNYAGKLWIVGNDWVYDRYASPPVIFGDQEFPNKYCGINSYDAQSYADDGGVGVSQLDLNVASPFTSVDPVYWIFPTDWYDDALTPVENAVHVYDMGPTGYALDGKAAAIYYTNANNNSEVLSFCFDPSLMSDKPSRDILVHDVLDFFNSVGTGIGQPSTNNISVFPNPAVDQIKIEFPHMTGNNLLTVADEAGRIVVRKNVSGTSTNLDIHTLSPGNYILKIQNKASVLSEKICIVR